MNLVDHFFNYQLEFIDMPIGIFIFIIVYMLWVGFLLPGSWMSMLGGLLYGPVLGTIYVFTAACLGAILTFFIARSFLQDWIRKRLESLPKFDLIEESIINQGLKVVILTRLSPAFPFGLLNFAYGLSRIDFKDFVIGLIAILPGTILYCSLGSIAVEIAQFHEVIANRNDLHSLALSIIGLLATLAIVIIIVQEVKKALQN